MAVVQLASTVRLGAVTGRGSPPGHDPGQSRCRASAQGPAGRKRVERRRRWLRRDGAPPCRCRTARRGRPGIGAVEVVAQVAAAARADIGVAVAAADHLGRVLLEPVAEVLAVLKGHLGVLPGMEAARPGRDAAYPLRCARVQVLAWAPRPRPVSAGAGALSMDVLNLRGRRADGNERNGVVAESLRTLHRKWSDRL